MVVLQPFRTLHWDTDPSVLQLHSDSDLGYWIDLLPSLFNNSFASLWNCPNFTLLKFLILCLVKTSYILLWHLIYPFNWIINPCNWIFSELLDMKIIFSITKLVSESKVLKGTRYAGLYTLALDFCSFTYCVTDSFIHSRLQNK